MNHLLLGFSCHQLALVRPTPWSSSPTSSFDMRQACPTQTQASSTSTTCVLERNVLLRTRSDSFIVMTWSKWVKLCWCCRLSSILWETWFCQQYLNSLSIHCNKLLWKFVFVTTLMICLLHSVLQLFNGRSEHKFHSIFMILMLN